MLMSFFLKMGYPHHKMVFIRALVMSLPWAGVELKPGRRLFLSNTTKLFQTNFSTKFLNNHFIEKKISQIWKTWIWQKLWFGTQNITRKMLFITIHSPLSEQIFSQTERQYHTITGAKNFIAVYNLKLWNNIIFTAKLQFYSVKLNFMLVAQNFNS